MKVILLCLLNFFICHIASAQLYYFMNDSASWKTDRMGLDPDFCWGHCEEYKVYIDGDTTINLVSYKKLFETFHSIMDNWSEAGLYKAAIREDSIEKKVYYILGFQSDTVPKLLYDFDLNMGDTFPGCYGADCIVDSLDSVLIGNNFHKRFWTTNIYGEHVFIIEGVGSQSGLLEYFPIFGFEHFDYLTCFKIGNEILYSNPDTPLYSCEISLPLSSSFDNSSVGLAISPNPFSDFVSFISPFQSSSLLSVMNSQGQIILKKQLLPLEKISLSDQELKSAGVILFRLVSDDGKVQSGIAVHSF